MKRFYQLYNNKYFMLLGRVFIGALFIYASIDKIIHPVSFAEAFINYNIAPVMLAPIVAIFIPWFEFIVGVMLLVGYRQHLAAFGISLMLIAFMFGISINLIRGVDMECGCFELFGMKEDLTLWTLIRDIIFIFLTLPALLREKSFASIDAVIERVRKTE